MHVWWAKQEEFSDELDDLEEAAAEAAERQEKAKRQEDAGAGEAGGEDASADADADPDAVKKAAAEAARVSSESISPQRRLATEKKKVNAALSKEKKARCDMLETTGARERERGRERESKGESVTEAGAVCRGVCNSGDLCPRLMGT